MGFMGWKGLRQGHVPSTHCREGMRVSQPAPLLSSRSFLCCVEVVPACLLSQVLGAELPRGVFPNQGASWGLEEGSS